MTALVLSLLIAAGVLVCIAAHRFVSLYFTGSDAKRGRLRAVEFEFSEPKRDQLDSTAIARVKTAPDPVHEAKVIRLRDRMVDAKKKS